MSERHSSAGSSPALPTWSNWWQALCLIVTGRTWRTALPVSAIVGTVLSAINEGSIVVSGHTGTSTWTRVGLNFVVPYIVASIGFVSPLRLGR